MKAMSFYGCDTAKLAEEYGTPLYVMSEDFIRDQLQRDERGFSAEI